MGDHPPYAIIACKNSISLLWILRLGETDARILFRDILDMHVFDKRQPRTQEQLIAER